MPRKNLHAGPPIAANPAHAYVVATWQKLRQNDIENVLKRATGSRSAATLMREILYWFMPCKQNAPCPRTTVYRHDRYWFCRTREEWKRKHEFSAQELETCYKHCADILDRDHFMYAAQRRTHYSPRFEKLRELLEHDEILQARLRSHEGSEASSCDESAHPVIGEPLRPVEGVALVPSVNSLHSFPPTITNTERIPVVPPAVGAVAPTPPLVCALEQEVEELENPPELSNQKVQVMLKAAEGKPLRHKVEATRPLSPHAQKFVGYLMVWQRVFEKEYPGRRHLFTDQHLSYARDLADQGVPLKQFQAALAEAWEVRGTQEGHDPLFMCRRHSRKFSLFCKHFTRMEEELVQEGML